MGDTQSPETRPIGDMDENENDGQKQPWARLVSIEKAYPNIHIKDDEVIIGRADAEGDERVSKSHCKIHRDPLFGLVNITNLSGNGTLINSQLIKEQKTVIIKEGDEIVLGPYKSSFPNYIFQIVIRVPLNHKKRTRQVSEERGHFACSICLNIWHDVVSVAPCLHSFCNACFSEWYKSCQNKRCRCPECRAVVSSVSRNHILCNLVKEFLEDNPHLKRPEEDILSMKDAAIVNSNIFKIDNADSFKESYEESGSDEEEDSENEQCPQCPIFGAARDGFQCSADTTHLVCWGCSGLMPERHDLSVPQKCAGCNKVLCDAYWRSQIALSGNSITAGCNQSGFGGLKPMNERTDLQMPRQTFNGNTFEQDVTKRYMAEKGLELEDVVKEWLIKLDSGEIEQPNRLGSTNAINSASYICNYCADEVVQHLLFKFRLSVPKELGTAFQERWNASTPVRNAILAGNVSGAVLGHFGTWLFQKHRSSVPTPRNGIPWSFHPMQLEGKIAGTDINAERNTTKIPMLRSSTTSASLGRIDI